MTSTADDITTPEAPDVDVRVYPFHGAQPRMPDLFHVACARHPDFGFCGNHLEASAARVEHLGKYHRPDRPSDLAAEVERLCVLAESRAQGTPYARRVLVRDLRALLAGREADQ